LFVVCYYFPVHHTKKFGNQNVLKS
jgi:hypothetical protein